MATSVRLSRRRVLLGLALTALLVLVALRLSRLLLLEEPPAPAPRPVARSPGPASPVRDPRRPLEERTRALADLVNAAGGPAPALELLRELPPEDAQVRAMVLTALARWPDDPRARAALLEAARAGVRDERLVAISVLAGLPGAWSAAGLRDLRADPDPVVRDRARQAAAAVE